MREAVVVSTARTGLTKSFRGEFNNTHGAAMAGHAIKHAIERAGVEPGEVEDVFVGCANPEGATGTNVGRNAALWAGCPVTTAGATVNRFCSSGLQTVAMAAQACMVNGVPVAVGGGVEQISLVQPHMNRTHITEESLLERHPDLWMAMIDTADTVAGRYGVTRELQDEYSLQSQLRCAAGQQSGAFDDEIVPFETTMLVTDRGDRRGFREGRHHRPRHLQPADHHAGRAGRAGAGARRGQVDHRRQRQPAFRRRLGLPRDGLRGGGAAQCRAARHLQGLRHRRLRAR